MSRKTIDAQSRSAIAQKLQEQGIELYELEYKKERDGRILRIYIDTPHGVDTDTCVLATRTVKDYIDALPDLDYDFLEVSSPGIDRLLRHDQDLVRYKGAKVQVKTNQPIDGKKKFIGLLAEFDPLAISIEVEGQLVLLPRELISVIRLHPDF